MRLFVVFFSFLTLVYASEPSAFGAGDLKNPNPYGLTAEEKLILENKKQIEAIAQKNNLQNAKVESVSEQIEGIKAIVEGLSQSLNEQKIALQQMTDNGQSERNASVTLSSLHQEVAVNRENITQLKTLLEELSHIVDGINTQYVSKQEFSLLMQQLKVSLPAKSDDLSKMSGVAVEAKAAELFKQKKYEEALPYYEAMIQKKHKVAEAYYWIGETYYHRKGFKEAINYYKESAAKNDKAPYMPTLLVHAGHSLEKNGDKVNAKAFYQATIAKFPDNKMAQEAEERLAKLR